MKTGWIGVAAALILVFSGGARAAVNVGDRPNLNLRTVGGQVVTPDAVRGKILIIDFWATWCGPCMAEVSHMVRIQKELGPRGVNILGISLDQNVETMKQTTEQKGMTWPQVCDGMVWKSPLVREWGVPGIPKTFILSPDGEVLWTGHPSQIDRPLEKALKEHPPIVTHADLVKRVVQQIHDANEAIDSDKDYAKALALIGEVPDNLLRDDAVVKEARELLGRFKPKGEEEQTKVKAAMKDDKEGSRALTTLQRAATIKDRSVAAPSSTTQPTADGGDKREDLAQTKLQLADKRREAGDNVGAYRGYKLVAARFRNTAAGAAAARNVHGYEADDKFMAEYHKADAEQQARDLFVIAGNYDQAGKSDLAQETFKKVIDQYPDTAAAKEARTALDSHSSR